MKKHLYSSLFILFLMISSASFAQSRSKAKCISSKGYWVVENNVKAAKSNTVYFYSNDNVLVYHEKVDGIKINTERRKTLLKLKSALEQAIVAWENGQNGNLNGMLVMTAFKK